VDSVVDAYPLNTAHRGILFHSLQCEEADVYLSVISLRVQGKLDTAVFQQAWQAVFSHHTSLRSGVVVDGMEDPLWVVHESIEPDWEVLDFSSLTPDQCEIKEAEALAAITRTKFAFASEVLMKFTLVKLSDDTHRLYWAVHHILSDGWSTSVVLEDVSTAYAACARGQTPSLPQTLAYSQFLASQANLERDQLNSYWSEYLRNCTPTPLRLSESVHDPERAQRHTIETRTQLDEARSLAIAEAARRYKTTSNTLLIGAWAFVLRDLCQHESPLFGVTLAGRFSELPAVERGVGLYASTLPFFVDTMDTRSKQEWLGDVGKSLQAHSENDALALVEIQKLVDRENNEPLFNTVVALAGHDSNLCFGAIEKSNILIDSVEFQIRSHFDVSLLIKPGQCTSLHLISQSEKLDLVSHNVILQRYTEALDLLIDPGCTSVSALRERWNQNNQQGLSTASNQSTVAHHRIDDWILDVARQQPAKHALVQGRERLTYAELEQRARQVSQALASKVDDHSRPIAIRLSNNIDAIVAMIGVLMSGRCYLPLDNQQPIARQAALCQDANCALIIAEQCAGNSNFDADQIGWPARSGLKSKTITLATLIAQYDTDSETSNASITLESESPAYLMYTSGSTGKPKGVLISHANLIYSTQARFDYAVVARLSCLNRQTETN